MPDVLNRFLRYVQFDTQSNEASGTVPSTPGQMTFAKVLTEELRQIGLSDVVLDEFGYVYAKLPSNLEFEVPAIGFIAHMDTSPDFSGNNIKPKIIDNYPGGDIILNEEKKIILSLQDFPELNNYKGTSLVTTDGTTLLGADDKAGVAEIITAIEYILAHPEIKHGQISIGFTPDEEVGRGADHFDLKQFDAEIAYTIDGGELGELEYECFNAAKAIITIHGKNIHPGHAKNKMINSLLLANEFISLLPPQETPEHTEGYEGFFHLNDIHGNVEETTLHYLIRDFDSASFAKRKDLLLQLTTDMNNKYRMETFNIKLTDQYQNMKEKIEPVKYIVDTACKAMEELGITPKISPIRGGTDGARLSFMGLPTPNLFTGGLNFHGKFEFIPVFALEKSVDLILKIIEVFTRSHV